MCWRGKHHLYKSISENEAVRIFSRADSFLDDDPDAVIVDLTEYYFPTFLASLITRSGRHPARQFKGVIHNSLHRNARRTRVSQNDLKWRHPPVLLIVVNVPRVEPRTRIA